MLKLRFILMPLVVTTVVLLQMASPVIARADDGTPPPDQPTQVATDPGTATTDVTTPTDTATPVPVVDAATTDVPPADAASPTDTPLMTQVPEGTDVVVVNPDGTTEPLATQQAAVIIATSDPLWCPTGQTPGGAGCTSNQASITDLLTYINTPANGITGAGTIYFQNGTYAGTETAININPVALPTLTDLGLEGGWDLGTNTLVTGGTTTFNVPIFITDWAGNVTVNNVTVSLPTSTPSGYGLNVQTTGDINVANVDVSGAAFDGAFLANNSGTGNVSVTNSTFSDNSDTGLEVWTTGNINVNTVTASNNTGGNGAYLNVVEAAPSAPADINSIVASDSIAITNSTFNGNGDTGVYAGTVSGNVTLTNVTASDNQYGAVVGTDAGNVSVTGSTFDSNNTPNPELDGSGIGLQAATSAGNVTLDTVSATGNDIGATVGSVQGNVSVNASTFSDNTDIGLEAGSMQGSVTLTNVVANNTTAGQSIGAMVGTLDGSITISASTFDGNTEKGLYIETTGIATNPDVTLTNVEASSNGVKGVYIEYLAPCGSTGGVTVDVVGGLYQSNGGFGIYGMLGPGGSLVLDSVNPPGFGSNNGTPPDTLYNYVVNTDASTCPPPEPEPEPESKPYNVVSEPETGGEPVAQNCTDYSGTVLVLPGEDKVTVNCPATGDLTLGSLGEGGLPGSLPQGPVFVSGLQFGLQVGGVPVTVLTDGGSIKLAFKLPEDAKPSDHFAILYWDPSANGGAGGWTELPAYAAHLDGSPLVFALHPGASPDDLMRILSGTRTLGGMVKATVNFPGVFVLVKK
jgi:hypothetical protein